MRATMGKHQAATERCTMRRTKKSVRGGQGNGYPAEPWYQCMCGEISGNGVTL